MKAHRQKIVIYALLTAFIAYCGLVVVPNVLNAQIIGFVGNPIGDKFLITGVMDHSPAALAGLRPGDQVISQDDRTVGDWYRLYRTNFGVYLRDRSHLKGREINYRIRRANSTVSLTVSPRQLTGVEVLRFYGVRVVLVVLIFSLTLFIVTFTTRANSAFLFCLCFCFAVFWFISDTPFWPWFLSPLIGSFPTQRFYILELFQIVSLQLVLSTLLHIVLTFPNPRAFLKKHAWILLSVHVLPLTLLAIIMFSSTGTFVTQIAIVNLQRPWLNTALLVIASVLMLHTYLTSLSRIHREQTRWIVVSMVVVSVYHIVTWNLPMLFLNKPLVPGYDWVLVVVALIPIAMTISITNHHLFGIRGIVRGRIYMLERLLGREKNLVIKRDSYISDLVHEANQLKLELADYMKREFPPEKSDSQQPSVLMRIETKYPQLKQLRQERLIGRSRCWERIFEEAALAAQGNAPVMIVGESGTGKTDIAWAIYQMSERQNHVYKELSCAQFEHGDPAFALGKFFGIGSGHGLPNVPKEGQPGILQECDGGTLFLDDIDRLPLNVQDLLLYPLEGKPFEPAIGKGAMRKVSIKFIFATNRQPEKLAAEGKFQMDVLARINARINLPPLRERPEDIPLLVDHFSERIAKDYNHEISVISPKAMKLLKRHPYSKGNVRELVSELQRAIGRAMLEEDHVLRAGYLSDELQANIAHRQDSELSHFEATTSKSSSRSTQVESNRSVAARESVELTVLKRNRFQLKPSETELGFSHKSRTMSNHLRGICIKALSENNWDPEGAARSLAGEEDLQTVNKLERKIRRFIMSVKENVEKGTEGKLFNNLPSAYHAVLEETIAQSRTWST